MIKQKEAHTKEQEGAKQKSQNGGVDTADTKATSGAEWFSVETMMEPFAIAGEKILGFAGDQVKKFVDRIKETRQERERLRNLPIIRAARARGRVSAKVSPPLKISL